MALGGNPRERVMSWKCCHQEESLAVSNATDGSGKMNEGDFTECEERRTPGSGFGKDWGD